MFKNYPHFPNIFRSARRDRQPTANKTQDLNDASNWISAQQAIDEVEQELEAFCRMTHARKPVIEPSTEPSSSTRPSIIIQISLAGIKPTEIDNLGPTSDSGPAVLYSNIPFPVGFPFTPESVPTLQREHILQRGTVSISLQRDPAHVRVPKSGRCPHEFLGTKEECRKELKEYRKAQSTWVDQED